jgi:hypothetical protein
VLLGYAPAVLLLFGLIDLARSCLDLGPALRQSVAARLGV